jgi:putative ABC transport system permease protein
VLGLATVNLLRRWGRSALSALGVAVGVTTVVALLALTGGLDRSAGDLAHLGRADLGVFQGGLADLTASSLPGSALAHIDSVPGVARTSPVQILSGAVGSEPSMLAFGAEPSSFLGRRLVMISGQRATGNEEVMLGSGAAATLHLQPGSTLQINGRPLRVSGIYRSGIPLEDSGVVLTLALSRELSGLPEGLSMVAVAIAPGYTEKQVKADIEHAVPGASAIGAPGELSRVDTNSRIIHEAAVIVAILALALGAVVVLNTMAMAVIERRSEFGVLAAVGWSRPRILRLLLGESLAVSLVGVAAGLLLGVAAAELVVRGLEIGVFVSPDVTAWVLVRGLLVGIALGALGALFASWRVMRMPLLEALGRA